MAQSNEYTTPRWARFKAAIIRRDMGICQMCGAALVIGRKHHRSAVVDHIRPAVLRPDLFYDPENTRAVCKRCHDTDCQRIERRHAGDAEAIAQAKSRHHDIGVDGWPL
jgi:5-methylcytosine-specific restriction endonuclease McrA